MGGESIKTVLEAEFDCRLGENGPDDAYGLWLGQCNGTCERAPQVWVNGRVVGPLTVAEAVRLARRIKADEQGVSATAAADMPIVPWRGDAEQHS